MIRKSKRKPVAKKKAKTAKKTATRSKLPAKKKIITKKSVNAKPVTRSMSVESIGNFPLSVIKEKGDFVVEKFSDTKYCCMRVLPDGRREEHICYKTEAGAIRHLQNKH